MKILQDCLTLLDSGQNVVMVTVLASSGGTPGKPGFKLVLSEQEKTYGTVGGGAIEKLALEVANEVMETQLGRFLSIDLSEIGMLCGGKVDLVFEYLSAKRLFLLFGGGHIAKELAPILKRIGFSVTVYDARPDILSTWQNEKEVELVQGTYEELSGIAEILGRSAFCFIATHSHEADFSVIRQLLETGQTFQYLGMIGSKTKIKNLHLHLEKIGLVAPNWLYAPVGIDIGSELPAEIAVSIAAEVVACSHQVSSSHLRL